MKKYFMLIALFVSQVTFSEIKSSKNEIRHQVAIESAIVSACGNMTELTQVAQNEMLISIDQGITDIKYKTLISGFARLDQMNFDKYEITAQSTKADMYDHVEGNWGVYSVESIRCIQK